MCSVEKVYVKTLVPESFFNKVGGLRPGFCEVLKNTFFAKHLRANASVEIQGILTGNV